MPLYTFITTYEDWETIKQYLSPSLEEATLAWTQEVRRLAGEDYMEEDMSLPENIPVPIKETENVFGITVSTVKSIAHAFVVVTRQD